MNDKLINENETVEDEVTETEEVAISDEQSEVEEVNPIADFISSIEKEEYHAATDVFSGEMGDRLADRLDMKKVEVASSIFNDEPDVEIDTTLELETEVEEDENI